jgi:voltage-gated potassium channel
LTTVTTVGYGDKFPVSTGGKIIAFFLMLLGISLVGIITASVASWFVKTDSQEKQDDKLDKDLQRNTGLKKKLT